MTNVPIVDMAAIAALGKGSSSTSSGRPQLSGPNSSTAPKESCLPSRPSKERVEGKTPLYREEDRKILWTWMDVLDWGSRSVIKTFGEDTVKVEMLKVWHDDIHKMALLVHDTLAIEILKAEHQGIETIRRASVENASKTFDHFRAAMIASLEYKEGGVEVNSLRVQDRGMSPRARRVVLQWLLEWGPQVPAEIGEDLISREADRRGLQVMHRYLINAIWFSRKMLEVHLTLANRQEKKDLAVIQKLNTAIDQTWTAEDSFRRQFKAACEADRKEMEERDREREARGEDPWSRRNVA